MPRGSFRGKTNKPSVFFVSRLDVGWRGKSAFRLRGGGGIGPRKVGVNGQVAMSALGSGHACSLRPLSTLIASSAFRSTTYNIQQ